MQIALVLISLLSFAALAAVIRPFRPFYTRKRAALTLVVGVLSTGIMAPKIPVTKQQAVIAQAGTGAEPMLWVTSDRLVRYTCPAATCGKVGTFFFRQGVAALEEQEGWVRVTPLYDAACQNGKSDYVDSGPTRCTTDNGITDGRFAEWVQKADLSETRPADPAAGATGLEAAVAQSDDYRLYKAEFVLAAQSLIDSGQCSAADLAENGGFMKSSNHASKPIYFTYCGGMTLANRLYLNVKTGAIGH